MTMTNDRWNEDPPLVIIRDGQTVFSESQELAQRNLTVHDAWAVYQQNGHRQPLVDLGILSAGAR